ncbi:hypothetical protein Zmor_012044 [Zophobas morio]|uniref:ABC transporter domain-containing protein n=1 Tax=Zophobas morio TaxID=2755281 RepID=A0AA38LZX6_9CUCU|nr:hypothetical protein Zmor_012044 [Zophobas morio]
MRYIILKTFRVVGLTSNVITQYPNELTSAQMTRIALARALVVQPKLIIVDEPTSALDATFSVIYLDLLKKIRDEFGISLIIIDNDIHFARQYADRIAIMNNGRVVEVAETNEILTRPLHAYTQKMVEALPIMKIDYVRPDIVPFKRLSKIDYLVDIPITMEVFPDHFAYLRDNEFDAIQKKYATNKKVEQKGND